MLAKAASNVAWAVGAAARQPVYAGLVGLGAAANIAVAVGAAAPARMLPSPPEKKGWSAAAVGLAKAALAFVQGFDPIEASARVAGFDKQTSMALAVCAMAQMGERLSRRVSARLDKMDAASPKGQERKAWREERMAKAQVKADATVEFAFDAPSLALGAVAKKLASFRDRRKGAEPQAPAPEAGPAKLGR